MAAADIKMVNFSSLNLNKDLGDGKYAQFTVSVRGGFPRLVAFTDKSKVRDDKKFDYNTMIIAPFDYTSFFTFLNTADEIIMGEKGVNKQIACYNTKFEDGQRTNDVVLQATVEIGQDPDGIIYLGVLAEGKKKVKFEISPKDSGKWHKYYVNGELVTDRGVNSRIFAKAYFAQLRRLVEHTLVADTIKSKSIERKVSTLADTSTKETIDTSSINESDLF